MFPHEEGEQAQVGQNQNKRSEVSTLTRRLTRSTAHFVLCWRWEPVRHSVIFHKVLRFTYIAIATSAWFLIGARGQSASLSSSTHTHTHTHTHWMHLCSETHTDRLSFFITHTHTAARRCLPTGRGWSGVSRRSWCLKGSNQVHERQSVCHKHTSPPLAASFSCRRFWKKRKKKKQVQSWKQVVWTLQQVQLDVNIPAAQTGC